MVYLTCVGHTTKFALGTLTKYEDAYDRQSRWPPRPKVKVISSHSHYVTTSHLCIFLIRETKCCTCVIRDGRGHTASAEPGGHILVVTTTITTQQQRRRTTSVACLNWVVYTVFQASTIIEIRLQRFLAYLLIISSTDVFIFPSNLLF